MLEPEARSLLIRGPPGSGKTTLALGLLESLPARRVLVTSRVPADLLALHHSWLRRAGSEVEVVDCKLRPEDFRDSARTASLWKAQSRLMPKESPGDEITSRDIEQLIWLPPELRELWLSLDPSTPAVVAIDSWDALVDLYLGSGEFRRERVPDRQELERILFEQVARARTRLVLVLERDDQTQLDYLSDAVVSTSVERTGDRVERWLRILKLRGIEIADSDYPFTLAGARFRCFPALSPTYRLEVAGCDPEPSPKPRYIWPGARTFAEEFGWLPWEQSTLIELDPTVSYEVARILVAPLVTHVLRSGGRAVIASPPSRAYSEVVRLYRQAASEDLVRANLRIMRMRNAPDSDDDLANAVAMHFERRANSRSDGADGTTEGRLSRGAEAYRFLTTPNGPGIPNVSVGFVPKWAMLSGEASGSDAFGGPTPDSYVWGIHRFLEGVPLHVVLIDRRDDAMFDAIAKVAGMHLRVRAHAGHISVHGVRPWTPDHALVLDSAPRPDRAPYELVRVV
jgi:hypothetical protein